MELKEFKLTIDVTIRGGIEKSSIPGYINDAVQELVNRQDFRRGNIKPGRVMDHYRNHEDVMVTVDVAHLFVQRD